MSQVDEPHFLMFPVVPVVQPEVRKPEGGGSVRQGLAPSCDP